MRFEFVFASVSSDLFINAAHKEVACGHRYHSTQHTHAVSSQNSVNEIYQLSCQHVHLCYTNEVVECIQANVYTARGSQDERTPLPFVVSILQLEVGLNYRKFSNNKDQKDAACKKRSKHSVHIRAPNTVPDVLELHKYTSKHNSSKHRHEYSLLHKPGLNGNLPGDLVGLLWDGEYRLTITNDCTMIATRNGNSHPNEAIDDA